MEALAAAIADLDEHSWCEGTLRCTERLAIMLPDGDVGAVDDPRFVDWLLEHGEPAPFGQDGETKVDPAIRHATRLIARGEARITGIDLTHILDEIAATLSPRKHLDATLTDVLVYPTGGRFARHKDTPTSPELLGTLIVALPFAHRGGAFVVDDGARSHRVDWSHLRAGATELPWVAFYSDADHEITQVTHGARVTLVYALSVSDREREDAAWDARLAAVRAGAKLLQMPERGPLMIACARHVIGLDGPQPQSIESLRGSDREIADVLVRAGFIVQVRTCLAVRDHEYDPEDAPARFRGSDPANEELYFARLARPFLQHDVDAILECVTFGQPMGDGGGFFDEENTNLEGYLADPVDGTWIMRRTAAATFLRDTEFAYDGFIGNGAIEAYLYKLAALEVTRR